MTTGERPDDHKGGEPWLIPLLVFTTLVAACVFGSRPMVSYRALALGAGAAEIGVIASSFAILAILAAIPLGRLIDRVGERRVMLLGAAICAGTAAAIPLVGVLAGLALIQALLGIGQLMAVVGAHTLLAKRGRETGREYRFGLYTSAASLGHAIGPAVAGIVAGEDAGGASADPAFLLAGGAGAVALGLALLLPHGAPNGSTVPGPRPAPDSVLRTLGRPGMVPAMTAGVVSLTAVDLLVAYLPVYGEARGISPLVVGAMLASLALCQMISRLGIGRLLERYGHASVLSGSILLAAAVVPILILDLPDAALVGVAAVAGLGLGLAQPLSLVWVTRSTPPESRGLAMGIRMGGNRLGQLLLPVAVGATAGQFGVAGILASVSGMLGVAGAYVIRTRRLFGRPGSPPTVQPAVGMAELE